MSWFNSKPSEISKGAQPNDLQELKAQIARDIAAANRFFARLRRTRSRGVQLRGE